MLNQDFKEFLQSLNHNQVRYLVVGGYAVAFHGHPRYTKDLDVWIDNTGENSTKLLQALAEFGFGSLGITEEDLLTPHTVIQLGYPPCRIDLINTLSGVDFAECYQARIQVDIEGIPIHFIDLKNLIKNKRAVGRHQDLADLEQLE